jgi:OOP family OmpA-OmpF porin
MKNIFLILSVVFSVSSLYAQDEIIAEGKITDTHTDKGVRSNIRYSSIPTGGITGRFSDSTFSFSMFGSSKYQITIEAKGYNSKTIIVDPKDVDASKHIIRNIKLVPKGQTIRLSHLIFPQGKSTIDANSYSELDEVVQMMKENSKIEIQLEGHTDNQGNPGSNLKLSEKRVEAVKKYIVAKGIGKDRVKTKAFGGSQPLSNEMTPEARALNRRVEMRILKD